MLAIWRILEIFEPSFGILGYLLDLCQLCMISCEATPLIFKMPILMGTYMHTHTISLLYTLVSASLSEIEFALRGFESLSDWTPLKEGQ